MEECFRSKPNSSCQNYNCIGFLATGNEIIAGDIINTNTPRLAKQLYSLGFKLGMHLVCSDSKKDLKKSLNFLLENHKVVIIVGGIGPTEDDKCYESVAEILNRPLIFHNPSWKKILKHLSVESISISQNSKKQSYFPEGSQILENTKGTADGCYINLKNKHLFMLPGPPGECFHMFDNLVLSQLLKIKLHEPILHLQWMLFGASELDISEKLNQLTSKYNVSLGYCASYPYIEIKLHIKECQNICTISKEITKVVKPFLVTTTRQRASDILLEQIMLGKVMIHLQKDATKGYVHSKLMQIMLLNPRKDKSEFNIYLQTEGMYNFWKGNKGSVENINLITVVKNREFNEKSSISFRSDNEHVFLFIYEWICIQVLRVIAKLA